MSEQLDPDVEVALNRAGLRPRTFRAISTMPSARTGRVAYRIELDSDRVIRARRLEDDATARRLFDIRRLLPEAFAAPFDCFGRVLLEEWIDGDALRDTIPSDTLLQQAGSLLAYVHLTREVLGRRTHDMCDTAAVREKAAGCLRSIRAAGEIDLDQLRTIEETLARTDPGSVRVGLVHTDFCGENMVVDPRGRLYVVDNERLGIGPLVGDVARTWYRWALPAPAFDRFRAAYATAVPWDDAFVAFKFWQLHAVILSAAMRLRLDPERAHVPLACLRAMVETPGAR
jgi:thiamine kinase-like enzyme